MSPDVVRMRPGRAPRGECGKKRFAFSRDARLRTLLGGLVCALIAAGCIDVGEPPTATGAGDSAVAGDTTATGEDLRGDVGAATDAGDARGGEVQEACEDATICDAGSGFCEAGACVPFAVRLPDGHTWWAVGDGPRHSVPDGCGLDDAPCATGAFDFDWPPDSGARACHGTSGSSDCPGTAGGDGCAGEPFCGQDAQYGCDTEIPGWAEARYSGNLDDGVVDAWTGLVWRGKFATGRWAEARAWCGDMPAGDMPAGDMSAGDGVTAWRLPTHAELLSVIDYGRTDPATELPGMPVGSYWTASGAIQVPGEAWTVSLADGGTISKPTVQTDGGVDLVVCVGQPGGDPFLPAARYFRAESVVDEPVLFDTRTGLLWQQSPPGGANAFPAGDWAGCLAACESMTYGGRTDWRLPNVRELRSLIDATRYDPAVDSLVFPATGGWFATSTPSRVDPDTVWYVNFTSGAVGEDLPQADPPYPPSVRCVAMGPAPPCR